MTRSTQSIAVVFAFLIGIACAAGGCQRSVEPPTVTVKPAARAERDEAPSQAAPADTDEETRPAATESAEQQQ